MDAREIHKGNVVGTCREDAVSVPNGPMFVEQELERAAQAEAQYFLFSEHIALLWGAGVF